MKRFLIIAAFAVQIITACGQGNATAGKTDSGTDKDTTWYANRIEEINTEAGKLTEEYKTIASGPQSDASNARIKQLREKYDSLTNVMKGTILEIAQKFKDSTFPAQFFQGDIAYILSYDELKTVCDPKSAYYNAPELKMARAMLAALEKRHPGMQYKELTMQDMNGKTVKLSDWAARASMSSSTSGLPGVGRAAWRCLTSLRLTTTSRIRTSRWSASASTRRRMHGRRP